MWMGELTSAKATPYLIAWSTDFSIDVLISGGYFSSNPSSSWSDEHRAFAYVAIIRRCRWAIAEIQMVSFAMNCNSREPLYFPTTIGSVFLSEDMRGRLVITTNPAWLSCGCQGSSNHWRALEGQCLCSPCSTSPTLNDRFSFAPQRRYGMLEKYFLSMHMHY